MFWPFSKKTETPEKEPEPTALVLEILHSFETEPGSWSKRWNDGKEVYAFVRAIDDDEFIAYFDGDVIIKYSGHLIKDPDQKSTGTLIVPMYDAERRMVREGLQKLIRANAIKHLQKEQKVPRIQEDTEEPKQPESELSE